MKRANNKKSRNSGVKPKPFALHRLISDAFPDKFDVRTIYHYTSSAVAQSLLNPKTAMLYCTWAKALNDEQEYKIGLEYALSHIAEVMNLDPEVLSEVKDVVALYETDDYRIPWVMSFSSERDLLGQWRAYTNRMDGGYAVGFSFRKLESLVEKIVVLKAKSSRGKLRPYILHLLPCFYLDYSSEKAMKDLDAFFRIIFVDYFNQTVKGLIDEKDPHQYAFAIASFICIFASVVKHSAFSEEKEYRLMIQLLDPKYEKNVEIVGGKPRLRISQKVTSRDVQELVSELWVSPHGDQEVLRAVAHFLKVRFNPKLDVYYSNAPFNGR